MRANEYIKSEQEDELRHAADCEIEDANNKTHNIPGNAFCTNSGS
jgi:hypothetical protein